MITTFDQIALYQLIHACFVLLEGILYGYLIWYDDTALIDQDEWIAKISQMYVYKIVVRVLWRINLRLSATSENNTPIYNWQYSFHKTCCSLCVQGYQIYTLVTSCTEDINLIRYFPL